MTDRSLGVDPAVFRTLGYLAVDRMADALEGQVAPTRVASLGELLAAALTQGVPEGPAPSTIAGPTVEFRILGPLAVRLGKRPVPVVGSMRRRLLAVLLVHANQVLSVDRLIDALWGDHPPETAVKTIHAHVSRLRKDLLACGVRRLHTRAPGYVLSVEDGELDVWRFERLVEDARRVSGNGDLEQAERMLGVALELWKGPPLGDFTYDEFARAEITRLTELRLEAIEDRLDLELALRPRVGLVGELRRLVEEHPLRERLHGQLMLALYRSGRQSEALRVYQDARRRLGESLGIEPSPELARLEEAILLHDPSLDQRPGSLGAA